MLFTLSGNGSWTDASIVAQSLSSDERKVLVEYNAVDPETFPGTVDKHQARKDLKLPPHTLIVFISHEKENIIAYGEYTIQAGDHIVFITHKDSIKKLDRLFDQRL